MGKPALALGYAKRALYLGILVSGVNHPDTATTLTNIAMMLQENGKFKEAIIYLLQALKCYDNLLGPNHIQTAAIYHAIAIAYSQLGQYKEALAFEKKNYSILHAKVGDTDIRAIESNICLKQFTQKAVQVQIETKKTQRAQMSEIKIDQIPTSLKAGAPKTINTTATPAPSMGTRPLNEILSYINGKSGEPSTSFLQRNSVRSSDTASILAEFGVNSTQKLPLSSASKKKRPKKKDESS